MDQLKVGNLRLKINTFSIHSERSSSKVIRSTSLARNPIRVVVDMMGEDGFMQQKIITQEQPKYNGRTRLGQFKAASSMPKLEKHEPTPVPLDTFRSTQPKGLSRSFVFNRFHYDNYRQFPIPKTRNSMLSKKQRQSNGEYRNIEVVFCENKLPDFVQKTNQKI
jgi:hypothetical protein